MTNAIKPWNDLFEVKDGCFSEIDLLLNSDKVWMARLDDAQRYLQWYFMQRHVKDAEHRDVLTPQESFVTAEELQTLLYVMLDDCRIEWLNETESGEPVTDYDRACYARQVASLMTIVQLLDNWIREEGKSRPLPLCTFGIEAMFQYSRFFDKYKAEGGTDEAH